MLCAHHLWEQTSRGAVADLETFDNALAAIDRETKEAYSFPFGDFRKVHRSGVIAGEGRAAQFDHAEIRDALKALLELIDGE